ncbi:MAG: OB-fold domain-containing protein [Acidobacteria bacterium]|nr:OB-fold domain-containing protein [Acidobacteriota bacterium]
MTGIVYTESVVHAAPAQLVAEAPYQIAIITLDAGGRLTARITGDRVTIGDAVQLVREEAGVRFLGKC